MRGNRCGVRTGRRVGHVHVRLCHAIVLAATRSKQSHTARVLTIINANIPTRSYTYTDMHFPVEVLQCTFAFACTDGGPTAANLSLVSHIFHDAVLPMRFHSVALRTARSPAAFLAAYHDQIAAVKERGSGLKPVVRHLFVSCGTDSTADPIRESLVERVLNIIALAAPTLETFSCTGQLISANFLITHMCNQPFPVLRELFTTRESCLRYRSRGDGPEVPKMPALRKLVLLTAARYVYPMLDVAGWKAYAPNVTEIRLWNVERKEAVGEPLRGHASWVSSVAFSADGSRELSCTRAPLTFSMAGLSLATFLQLTSRLPSGTTSSLLPLNLTSG